LDVQGDVLTLSLGESSRKVKLPRGDVVHQAEMESVSRETKVKKANKDEMDFQDETVLFQDLRATRVMLERLENYLSSLSVKSSLANKHPSFLEEPVRNQFSTLFYPVETVDSQVNQVRQVRTVLTNTFNLRIWDTHHDSQTISFPLTFSLTDRLNYLRCRRAM